MTDLSAAVWRKAERSSDGNNCVEVATNLDVVGLRDSKDKAGPVLVVGPDTWRAVLAAAKGHRLDR